MPGAPFQKNAVAVKAFHVSWDRFHRDARALAWRSPPGRFSDMVAITRGGLVPAAIVARELDMRVIETSCVASYAQENIQGEMKILKSVLPETARDGEGLLVVDDLADTGATVKIAHAILPKAHVATVYAKPLGRPFVDTFITEVSQGTWIYFPWDLGLSFQGVWPRLINADLVLPRAALNGACLLLLAPLKPMAASGRGETGRRKGLKIISVYF